MSILLSFQSSYQRLKSQHDPSDQMTDDEFRLYLDAAGGFDKKTRVFGLGVAARELFTPPPGTSSRVRSSASTSYTPSIASQYAAKTAEYAAQNAQLLEEMAQMKREAEIEKRRRQAMEARLAQQFGWTFDLDETCTPDPPPGPRDNFPDDGHGFGSSQQPVEPLG
jgi:hypothetical protein